eukprot:m51a1_g10994 hypothetical protein (363) ;mRNA; r:338169-339608
MDDARVTQHVLPFTPCCARWLRTHSRFGTRHHLLAVASRDAPGTASVLRVPLERGQLNPSSADVSGRFDVPSATDSFTDLCFDEFAGKAVVVGTTVEGSLVVQSVGEDGAAQGEASVSHLPGDDRDAQLLCVAASRAGRPEVVAGCDSGALYVAPIDGSGRPSVISNARVGAVYDVEYAGESLLLAAGAGCITGWDMREPGATSDTDRAGNLVLTPKPFCNLVCEGDVVNSIAVHPSQYYLVAGRASGKVDVWDLRQPRIPVGTAECHKSHVWDVKFNEACPTVVMTCGQDTTALTWRFWSSSSGFCADVKRVKITTAAGGGQLGMAPLSSVDIHPETQQVVVASDADSLYFVPPEMAFKQE